MQINEAHVPSTIYEMCPVTTTKEPIPAGKSFKKERVIIIVRMDKESSLD